MKPIHILLVEDNEGDIVLTVEALKDIKFANNVTVVRDGCEALKYIENSDNKPHRHEPDLILLDVNLPKVSGHEVLKKVKNNSNKKHIPIVMLTTSSSENDVIKSYQNHANCYITKPVDVYDFGRVTTSIENFWFSILQVPKKT